MSKNLIAAVEQQGSPTPTTLPKHPVLVNQIHLLIENEMLLPLGSAADHLNQIDVLFRTIRDIASAPVDARADANVLRLALIQITSLCSTGSYQASDIANYVDCMCESARDDHMPTILAAVGGEA